MNHIVRVYSLISYINSVGEHKLKKILLDTIPCYDLIDAKAVVSEMKAKNNLDLCYRYECNGLL